MNRHLHRHLNLARPARACTLAAALAPALALGLTLATGGTARAQTAEASGHAGHGGVAAPAASAPLAPAAGANTTATTAPAAADWVDGEVRKVDTAQGRLTLRHGPLPALSMPPMTMVFRVAEPALLDGLKAGDAVRFTVERRTSGLTVTRIEPAAR